MKKKSKIEFQLKIRHLRWNHGKDRMKRGEITVISQSKIKSMNLLDYPGIVFARGFSEQEHNQQK